MVHIFFGAQIIIYSGKLYSPRSKYFLQYEKGMRDSQKTCETAALQSEILSI